jgi:DNA mismatch repair ATPase MutS
LMKTFDIHIDAAKRIPFSVVLGTKKHQQHALLTGPNRGGKSTALRSIGRSVYLAHNFGIAIGVAAAMTPMSYIQTCLRLEDIPGNSSLFEREVAVASLALTRSKGSPGLLLIDELFHSTNPPDAEIASRIFLNELWESKKTISVISTHMFQLLEGENYGIQKLCCPAEEGPNETITYHYGLTQGICKVSSVREILREQGFSATGKDRGPKIPLNV